MTKNAESAVPRAAYCEDIEEESQEAIAGTRQTANISAKRRPEGRKPRRDEASDSGYSSRTVTTGSSKEDAKKQTTTKQGFLRSMARKVSASASKKGQSKPAAPAPAPASALRRTVSRKHETEDLRLESQQDAARMRVSGTPAPPKQLTTASQPRPPAIATAPPQVSRPPSNAAAQSIAIPRPHPGRAYSMNSTHPRARPVTYHEGLYPTYTMPASFYERPQQPPQLMLKTTFSHPQHSSVPTHSSGYIPTPSSGNRSSMYPFPPTVYDPHPFYPVSAGPWAPAPHVEPARRPSWSTTSSVPEYPRIPHGYHPVPPPPPPTERPFMRPLSIHHPEPGPVLVPIEHFDGVLLDEEDEDYYRRQDRQRMPPPPRPVIPHRATASSSTTYRAKPSHSPQHTRAPSPRKLSIEDRPSSRPPLASRHGSGGSNDRSKDYHHDESVAPAVRRRLQNRLVGERPQSYHGGGRELEKQVEAYQASHHRPPLTAENVRNKQRSGPPTTAKVTHRGGGGGGGSDAGSRASSSREGSDSKKRANAEKHRSSRDGGATEAGEKPFSVTIPAQAWAEGRTVKMRKGDIEMTIGNSGARSGSTRDGRAKERSVGPKRTERRYSVRGRAATVKSEAREERSSARSEPKVETRSPSSRPSVRREASGRREVSTRRERSSQRATSRSSRRRSPSRASRAVTEDTIADESGAPQGVSLALEEGELAEGFRRLRMDSVGKRNRESALAPEAVTAVEGGMF